MDIVVVRNDEDYKLNSLPTYCCDTMSMYMAVGRVDLCELDAKPIMFGSGFEFNYCFHCGQKINIGIEEVK